MTPRHHGANMSLVHDGSGHAGSLLLPSPFPIRSVESDNYRTKTITLDISLNATPGQFVMAWLPRFDEKPFSLVASDPVTLMITAVGPFTNLLHELRPGDMLWIRGPFGNGFRLPRPGMRAAFVGGGYGVAPLLWLARAWRPQLAALTVIIGAGTAADLLYAGRFTSLRTERQEAAQSDVTSLELLTCTEDGSAGESGLVTDLLAAPLAAGEIDLLEHAPAVPTACSPQSTAWATFTASSASYRGRRICAAPSGSAAHATERQQLCPMPGRPHLASGQVRSGCRRQTRSHSHPSACL